MDRHKFEYEKAIKFIDKIIKKAEQERDIKGYRENLGYDQDNKVIEYLEKLTLLTYPDKSELLSYFYNSCNSI